MCKVYLVDSREVASPSSFTFVNNVSKLSQIAPPKMSSTPPNLRISIALFNLQRSGKREIPMNTIHAIIWCFWDISSSPNFFRPSFVQLYGLEAWFSSHNSSKIFLWYCCRKPSSNQLTIIIEMLSSRQWKRIQNQSKDPIYICTAILWKTIAGFSLSSVLGK